ncbi:MFS transporter, partial [Actinomadura rubrisoli]
SGIVVFTVASLVGGLSESAGMLVGARAVQGVSAAIVAPATLTVLGTTFTEPAAKARAFGIWGGVVGFGGAFGVLAGGALTELSWRWTLFVNVPIGIVLAVGAALVISEYRGSAAGSKLDVLGAVCITGGLMAIVYGIVEAERYGWGSGRVLASLAGGLVLLALAAVDQFKIASEPLIPPGVFRFRGLSAANGVAFAGGAAMFSMFYFMTLFLQGILDYSPMRTGLAYLPLALAILVGAVPAGKFVQNVGARPLLLTGSVLCAGGLLWLSRIDEHSTFAADVLGPTMLIGFALGVLMAAVTVAGTSALPLHQTGLGSGLINATRQLGGALGLALLVTIAGHRTKDLLAGGASADHASVDGFALALAWSALFPAVAAVIALAVPRKQAAGPAKEPPAPPRPEAISTSATED